MALPLELNVAVGGRVVRTDLSTKSVRKAVKTLAENGADRVALVLQGNLSADGTRVEDAGLIAQVKEAKAEAAA